MPGERMKGIDFQAKVRRRMLKWTHIIHEDE